MKLEKIPSEDRGGMRLDWLEAKYSFSFAQYYNPSRMHYGPLRVLNDDIIAPASGFPPHPHENMEIITLVHEGRIEHKDSMGNEAQIQAGEIQVMSAGRGIQHSEANPDPKHPLRLFQIWIIPNKRDVQPRYQQKSFDAIQEKGLHLLVGPVPQKNALEIYQDAYLFIGNIHPEGTLDYSLQNPGNGVYIIVISGEVNIENHPLKSRDALTASEFESLKVTGKSKSRILFIEVPLGGSRSII